MGLFYKKSIKMGLFRLNLSKSGIGASVGVRGARIGTGPKGNYISLGRKGLYYRTTLGSHSKRNQEMSIPQPQSKVVFPDPNEHESFNAIDLCDSSSFALLQEINTKRTKPRLFPAVLVLAFILLNFSVFHNIPIQFDFIVMTLGLVFSVLAFFQDRHSKTVVLFYDLDHETEMAYTSLLNAFNALSACEKIWYIKSQLHHMDWKHNAGATTSFDREIIKPHLSPPAFIKCNIEIPCFATSQQSLYFFPDRVLVYDRKGVGALSYNDLQVTISQDSFVEGEKVPEDATVKGYQWQYPNKDGGPDRRYKNNKQIPIAVYDNLLLSVEPDFRNCFQISRPGIIMHFQNALLQLKNRPRIQDSTLEGY